MAQEERPPKKLVHCSFCKKSQREVKKIIAGPEVFICDECVDICLDILAEDRVAEEAAARLDGSKREDLRKVLDERVVGQGEAKDRLIMAIHAHWRRTSSSSVKSSQSPNLLLVGPTGTGKTEALRCLAKQLSFPFVLIDATRLSGGSYFREQRIFDELLMQCDGKTELAETGVVCLDQLDHLASPGNLHPEGRRIQASLLSALDGGTVQAAYKTQSFDLDTSRMLFIGCGEFAGAAAVGEPPTSEDLVRFGMLPALMARFSSLAVFKPLGEAELLTVLRRPDSNLLEQYRALFRAEGVDLVFSDQAVEAIAAEAVRRKGGARSLRSILENIAIDLSFRFSSQPRPESFVVEANHVRGV